VKLTDFGVAVQVGGGGGGGGIGSTGGSASPPLDASCDPLSTETGTYRWMAPEVTRHEGYTRSADVFSYGMLLFELLAHEVPFADRPPLQAAVAIGLQDLRPPLPDGTPEAMATLVKRCWSRRPALRPKFEDVLVMLTPLHGSLTPEETQWLDEPHGHPVYSNAAESGAAPNTPSPAAQRPATRAAGTELPIIIEAPQTQPASRSDQKQTLAVSGT